jgi:hypothetical protein
VRKERPARLATNRYLYFQRGLIVLDLNGPAIIQDLPAQLVTP